MIRTIRPRVVTFDVTGTLLMTKLEEYYSEIGVQHGLPPLEPSQVARSFKANFKNLSSEHPIYGKHSGLGWENWWRKMVHNVFTDQYRDIPISTLDKVAHSLIKCYGTSMCWHKYPGTVELLDYLHGQELVLGVVSNFDTRLDGVLVDTKIRPYFSFVLTSYDFGIEKPERGIFDEALRLTSFNYGKIVESDEAVHVGDTVENDYFGARRAGWRAKLVTQSGECRRNVIKVPKEDIVSSLPELKNHLSVMIESGRRRA